MNEKIEYILSSLDFIHNLENKIKNTKKKFVTKSGECKQINTLSECQNIYNQI